MAGEQQLERSVLEQKDRGELNTIAGALGIKVNSRAKKETVVEEILSAAGVSSNGAGTATKSDDLKVEKVKVSSDDKSSDKATASENASAPVATAATEAAAPSERVVSGRDGGGSQERYQGRGRNNDRNDRNRGRNRGRSGGRDGGREREPRQEPAYEGEPIPVTGFLDLRDEGFGFLRTQGYLPSRDDVYVSISMVRK